MNSLKNEYIPTEEEESSHASTVVVIAPSADAGGVATVKVKVNDKPAFNLELYTAVRKDRRVPHGAFRLWCWLYDMAGSRGCCYPGLRSMAFFLKSALESVIKWHKILHRLGYLLEERITHKNAPEPRKHGGFIYRFPDRPPDLIGKDRSGKTDQQKAISQSRSEKTDQKQAISPKRSVGTDRKKQNETLFLKPISPPKSPSGGLESSGATRRGEKRTDEKNRESEPLRPDESLQSQSAERSPTDTTPDPEAMKEKTVQGGWTKKTLRIALSNTRDKLRRLESDPHNFIPVLHKEVQEAVTWLENEADRLETAGETAQARHKRLEATRRRKNRQNWQRGPLKPEIVQLKTMLERRAAELEAALHPAEPKPGLWRTPGA